MESNSASISKGKESNGSKQNENYRLHIIEN